MTISLKELDRLHACRISPLERLNFDEAMDGNWPAISRALRAAKAVAVQHESDRAACGTTSDCPCSICAAMEAIDD